MSSMVETEFAVGEQTDAIRKQFWLTSYTQCPRCQSENIAVHFWCCGRELNGDGWGTLVYQCLGKERTDDVKDLQWNETTRKLSGEHGCGFYTSFYYDERRNGLTRYETAQWGKS